MAEGISDEAEAWLRTQDAMEHCAFDEEGCCGSPEDHDFCGMCPKASAEHPDRNGGWPGKGKA